MRGALPLCLALALLTGCGDRQPGPSPRPAPTVTPTPAPPTDAQLLRRVLRRRARAVEAARRVRRLGLTSARYVVARTTVRGDRALLRVRLSYGVRGVAGDFGLERVLRARRRRGAWRISGAAGERRADAWDIDDYRREQSPHFVVWTPRDIPAPIAALEASYARMRDVLDRGRLRRRYLVVIARDGEHARRLTQRIGGLDSLAALTDTEVQLEGPAERVGTIASLRLLIVQSSFATGGATVQRTVITHELTHAALAPITSGRTPSWLTEGVAEYVSEDDRRAEAARDRAIGTAPSLRALSAPDAIGRLGGAPQSAAYAAASAAAYAIAERYGRERLLRLYEAYGNERLHGRPGDPALTDRAARRVLGVSLAALQGSL